jgi:hypothetical protein
MQIHRRSQVDKAVSAYHARHITLLGLVGELEWYIVYWDIKIHRGTKAPADEQTGVPMPPTPTQDRKVR